ncbi:putative karyopherin Kap95 [Blattamonas nauphoetae]|uniref:Karyopherin Kap95 n=1 Tax=Blattamonas nauphoetae TaxID=2049346 RepID=A0ABQ9X7X4_9EUKA|nr:putative karyopherin Kap95 [Blattamonas nauphoetae]
MAEDLRYRHEECYEGALINTLQTASRGIARSAARVATLIAVIEIPCGQWNDFYEIMETNLGQEANPDAYHAFLTCLGYTCQDLDKSVEIKKPCIILRSVCPFLDPECGLELNEVAINALNNSIEFCRPTFANTEERHTLVNIMINACNSASDQVRTHAYECLIKTFSIFYPLLDPADFHLLFDMTINNLAMTNPINKPQREVDSLIPSVLEIWIVIAEVENTIQTTGWYSPRTLQHSFSLGQRAQFTINRPPVIFHCVCQQIFQELFPLLCLILQSKPDNYDTPSWDKFHSTAFLMQMFVKVRGDEAADQIVNYVNEHIRSDDWHMKDTLLQLLGCIFVGTTRNTVIITIKNKLVGQRDLPPFMKIIKKGLELHTSPFIRGQITTAFKSIVKNNLENQNCLDLLIADFSDFNKLIVDIFGLLRQDDPRCVVSGVPLEFVYLCRGALNSGIFPQDVIRHIHEGTDSMLQFVQCQKENQSRLFCSLVALVKAEYPFDDALLDRAAFFLRSIEPNWDNTSADKLIRELVPSSAGSPSGFVESVLTLVSSPHSRVAAAALSFLNTTTGSASHAVGCSLVESGLVSNVLTAVQPHTLSISGNEEIFDELIRIVRNCSDLTLPYYLRDLGITSAVDAFNHREMIFQKIVLPSSQFVTFLISNRPFHYPTLDFVLASPIAMAFSTCLSFVETEIPLWITLDSINDSLEIWKYEGAEVVQSGKRIIRAQFSEGFEDTLVQTMMHKKFTPAAIHSFLEVCSANLCFVVCLIRCYCNLFSLYPPPAINQNFWTGLVN